MSTPLRVPIYSYEPAPQLRECERCYQLTEDDELILVIHPESYGVAGSPDTYELVCMSCLRLEADRDDQIPF